jgi:histidinol-phosphatase
MTEAGAYLALLEEIADQTDEIALRLFREATLGVDVKPDRSPVSEADRAIESLARAVVRRRYPGLGILGEEEGEVVAGGQTRLIIDPIDATANFVRGIPIFATLLAIEDHGEVVAGVVSAPALHTRWKAARGSGAFSGQRRLLVSTIDALSEAQLFHSGLGGGTFETPPPPGLQKVLDRAGRSRGFGDFYQHMLVAEGAGEVAVDPGVHVWDVAAVQVIVEEAGGRATTLSGERNMFGGSLVTSNGLVHEGVLGMMGVGSGE